MRPSDNTLAQFDRKNLADICVLPEQDFGSVFDMTRVNVAQRKPSNFYYYRDNGSDILAVAHLDTVAPAHTRRAHFAKTQDGLVIHSRALDDRLGAYIILDLLPRLDVTCDWLLTVGEETGESTADFFQPEKAYNWVIEFDRGGTDVVMYQYDDEPTSELVEASGARVGNGIFSDICYLEHLGVKGFNWGVGYRDYHGPRSHAYLNDTLGMVDYFLNFHDANSGIRLPHSRARRHEWWEKGTSRYDDRDDTKACVMCGARDVSEWDVCRGCNTCQDCLEHIGDCQCYTGGQGTAFDTTRDVGDWSPDSGWTPNGDAQSWTESNGWEKGPDGIWRNGTGDTFTSQNVLGRESVSFVQFDKGGEN